MRNRSDWKLSRSVGHRLHRLRASPRNRVAQPWIRWRRREGIYHSIYDDFYWYTHFSDTDFVYGKALAQTIGMTVMRLADADVLAYRFSNLADAVNDYLKEVQDLLKQKQSR